MPTAVNYGVYDAKAIRAVVDLMTVASMQAVCGTGWLGWYEAQESIGTEPAPSSDLGNPTMFGRWAYRHNAVQRTLDPLSDVVREGAVHLFVLYQPGCPFGRIEAALEEVRRVFHAASGTSAISYFAESEAFDVQPLGGFSVKELPLRFVGC